MSTIHLVDPAARPIAASLKAFDPEHESLDAFRAQSRATYAQISPPMPEAREEHLIAGSPAVRVLVYRPRQPGPPSAAIVYLHGGGFITGEAEIADATCVRLAQENNAVVVNVDYRLAPEAPFPGPVEDCYTALTWTLSQATSFGFDPSRVVVMGHSAGGGLAAATALLHRDRGGAPLAGQVLIYPMLDARTGTADAPVDNPTAGEFVWTRPINRFAWRAMRGAAPLPSGREGHYSPSLASDLKSLPPTFLAVGSLDLFMDEDVDYALRLSRAGVPVEMHVYAGGVHGFDLFPGNTTDRFSADLRSALGRFLAKEST